ncbi:MAG: glycosyltransferase family 4 protein [Candidatus Thiodiazotropha lotti]|nr:glycosyltransferase family 4 protein [Candidatus Thiodiazotropha lotti]MCW4219409.1 glycosyltransferase family 4 protein [Candidatus Thiodiazotropha lotti]
MESSGNTFGQYNVAIVHDWLTVFGGAERVLEQLLKLFKQADIYTIVDYLDDKDRSFLNNNNITTSFVQKLPFSKKHYRSYLPLMPLAIEQFDLSQYDLVISSSYAVAKGVLTGPNQLHISYVHSPIRYAWDLQHEYLHTSGFDKGLKSILVRWFLHKIRIWDHRTSSGVDEWIANSTFIKKRIRKVYRCKSKVIHPPVNTNRFKPTELKKEHYFTVSRMVPYKRIDLIVNAFKKMPDKELIVIGDGPEFGKINKNLTPNIKLLGFQSSSIVEEYMSTAKAFIFAAQEDFGIVPVEAQACGIPVIAYGKGGVLDSVEEGKTGMFFSQQTEDSLIQSIQMFELNYKNFDSNYIRKHADKFSEERFRNEMSETVQRAIDCYFDNKQ